MNEPMKNYKLYLESLKEMEEPIVPKAKIDMRGAIAFAEKIGTTVENLTPHQKREFEKISVNLI